MIYSLISFDTSFFCYRFKIAFRYFLELLHAFSCFVGLLKVDFEEKEFKTFRGSDLDVIWTKRKKKETRCIKDEAS